MHLHIYIYMYHRLYLSCISSCTCIFIWVSFFICIFHIYIFTCICICICVFIFIFVFLFLYLCFYMFFIYIWKLISKHKRWAQDIDSRGVYWGLLNSLTNPIMYLCLNRALRAKVGDLFHCGNEIWLNLKWNLKSGKLTTYYY